MFAVLEGKGGVVGKKLKAEHREPEGDPGVAIARTHCSEAPNVQQHPALIVLNTHNSQV